MQNQETNFLKIIYLKSSSTPNITKTFEFLPPVNLFGKKILLIQNYHQEIFPLW
jgi:hypothetical protein